MKKIIYSILILCYSTASLAQQDFIKVALHENRVEIALPLTFTNENRKDVNGNTTYQDKLSEAKLTYQLLQDSITDNETSQLVDRLLMDLKQQYPHFEYIDDGIHLQNWKNIGYIKFSSKDNRKKIFNYVFFISVKDKPMLFTFRCQYEHRKKWEPIADIIANSLRVKE